MGKRSSKIKHQNTINLIPEVSDQITSKDCQNFILPIKKAKVIDVYDGDTFTIATYLSINNLDPVLYKFPCRLANLDAPEMNPNRDAPHFKNLSDKEIDQRIEAEKELAIIAKDHLSVFILGKEVTFLKIRKEKYGRLLVIITCDGININDLMLEKRLAVPYDGGKKQVPNNWMKWYKSNL